MPCTVETDNNEDPIPFDLCTDNTDDVEWLSYTKPQGSDRKITVRTVSGALIAIHSARNTPGEGPSLS